MSDGNVLPLPRSLPAPVVYPQRRERELGWIEPIETVIEGVPGPLISRLFRWRAERTVRAINRSHNEIAALDDNALARLTAEIRRDLRTPQNREVAIARSFAIIRELATRTIGLRHHDVQLQGGLALLRGMVAEMDTGEGKTLTATLAAGTVALSGTPVHVVTVNDYLARRDAELMAPVYHALGLSVGVVYHGLDAPARRTAYAADIVYASNKEIVFDYLRDRIALGAATGNLRLKLEGLREGKRRRDRIVMRGLHFAIVDEADSVLVDEARTPLIISRETEPGEEAAWAEKAMKLVVSLEAGRDYRIIGDERRIELTIDGKSRLARIGAETGGIWSSRIRREDAARQALAALHLFHAGEHYLVRDDIVEIVDEYTGRIMADRSWNEGLHQLIEVKEGCPVTGRKVPVARISYQRFFRRYQSLAGMTGTAREVGGEFWNTYRLRVARIPTNRPSQRRRQVDRIYRTQAEKWRAIADASVELTAQGRPVLIGTRSVATSEALSEYLAKAGVEHVVLNAKQDQEEARIIAQAGEAGQVTVATNMAGRGVDIALSDEVLGRGGLHVILSERHDAGRIDRQLFGRCGRQGEPGSCSVMVSLEDPLIEFLGGGIASRLARLPGPVGHWLARRAFDTAQRHAERLHARTRLDLLKLDRRLGTLMSFAGEVE